LPTLAGFDSPTMSHPRTLRLTEYRPREVRLRRADVDALLAHPRQPVEVVPTRQPGRYRLTAQGFAGVLHTPNLRVVLRPKIPRANLFLLIDPDAPPDTVPDSAAAEPGTEALDFLARRLGDEMRARAAAGLRRGYVERADQQPFLQGRLDVAAQSRETPAARARFHTTREEFSPDLPVHRLAKATAEALLASPFVAADTRAGLRLAAAGYAEVPAGPVDPAAFDALPSDRLSDADRALMDLCRLLINGLRPADATGDVAGPSFLLDLERVFERYVERGLRPAAGSLEVQREFVYHAPVPAGQPSLTGRPDFVLRRGGTVASVLDAKWKALDGPPPAADVHQALAYGAGLGCRDVRLIYPGRRYRNWRYELTASETKLIVHSLRVVGPAGSCARSVERLRKALLG
jgi:5-methylcytosine-specific restriction enzyme subunit McrC